MEEEALAKVIKDTLRQIVSEIDLWIDEMDREESMDHLVKLNGRIYGLRRAADILLEHLERELRSSLDS